MWKNHLNKKIKSPKSISNARDLWWSTLGPLIWPQVWVQNGLVKQYNRIKIATTKLVKCMKNWNMISRDICICRMFLRYRFRANLLFILWFSLILHCLKAGFVYCPRYKLVISDLTIRDCEYCWWFLLNRWASGIYELLLSLLCCDLHIFTLHFSFPGFSISVPYNILLDEPIAYFYLMICYPSKTNQWRRIET